jgi:hypothetical protein
VWSLDQQADLAGGAKQTFPILAWLVFVRSRAAGARLRRTASAYLTIAGFMLGLLSVLGMTL